MELGVEQIQCHLALVTVVEAIKKRNKCGVRETPTKATRPHELTSPTEELEVKGEVLPEDSWCIHLNDLLKGLPFLLHGFLLNLDVCLELWVAELIQLLVSPASWKVIKINCVQVGVPEAIGSFAFVEHYE